MENETWVQIPMPTLLADGADSPSDRDPSTSSEGHPGARPIDNQRVAAYARQLWTELDRVSRYLCEHVAGDGNGPLLADGTSLLATDEDWQRWRAEYARVLSTLAGPAGDEGYGAEQAQLLYQGRAAR